MDVRWDPTHFKIDPSRPLYEQFAEYLRSDIARGQLLPGARLPSVRELAIVLRANPNTVMRTYQQLERERLVVTYRGQGTFVTDSPEVISESKRTLAQAALARLKAVADSLGLSVDELIHLARTPNSSSLKEDV